MSRNYYHTKFFSGKNSPDWQTLRLTSKVSSYSYSGIHDMKATWTPIDFDGVCHQATSKSKINSLYLKKIETKHKQRKMNAEKWYKSEQKVEKKNPNCGHFVTWRVITHSNTTNQKKWSRKHQAADAFVGRKRANLVPWRHSCVPELFLFSSAEICKGAVSVSLTGHWTAHGRGAAAERSLQSFRK